MNAGGGLRSAVCDFWLALFLPPSRNRAPMPPDPHSSSPPAPTNRLSIILTHIPWYTCSGLARLAADVGVSRSTVSRLASGKQLPSVAMAQRVTRALSEKLGRPLAVEEVFSADGTYPEPSGCRLMGCSGCYPEGAHDRRGNLRPAFRNQRPGDWSLSHPRVDKP
jgi:transcriptional regulator with XRE-family HTH domain